jgi:hypothetical protein
MNSTKQTARIAGVLYLVNGVTGFFSIIYVPSRLMVPGNAAATAGNIIASERLFRLGIASEVICAVEIYLSALGSLPTAQRGEQDACFPDGDLRSGLRSHYVHERGKRYRGPDALARRGFPVGIRPTAKGIPGHAVPRFAWLRVRCRLDFWPLAFPLRSLCMEVAFPSPLPGRAADRCMFRISGRKSYAVASAELREPRGPNREHPADAGRTSDYLVAFD